MCAVELVLVFMQVAEDGLAGDRVFGALSEVEFGDVVACRLSVDRTSEVASNALTRHGLDNPPEALLPADALLKLLLAFSGDAVFAFLIEADDLNEAALAHGYELRILCVSISKTKSRVAGFHMNVLQLKPTSADELMKQSLLESAQLLLHLLFRRHALHLAGTNVNVVLAFGNVRGKPLIDHAACSL